MKAGSGRGGVGRHPALLEKGTADGPARGMERHGVISVTQCPGDTSGRYGLNGRKGTKVPRGRCSVGVKHRDGQEQRYAPRTSWPVGIEIPKCFPVLGSKKIPSSWA